MSSRAKFYSSCRLSIQPPSQELPPKRLGPVMRMRCGARMLLVLSLLAPAAPARPDSNSGPGSGSGSDLDDGSGSALVDCARADGCTTVTTTTRDGTGKFKATTKTTIRTESIVTTPTTTPTSTATTTPREDGNAETLEVVYRLDGATIGIIITMVVFILAAIAYMCLRPAPTPKPSKRFEAAVVNVSDRDNGANAHDRSALDAELRAQENIPLRQFASADVEHNTDSNHDESRHEYYKLDPAVAAAGGSAGDDATPAVPFLNDRKGLRQSSGGGIYGLGPPLRPGSDVYSNRAGLVTRNPNGRLSLMLGRNGDDRRSSLSSVHSFQEEGVGEADVYGLASNPVRLTQQQQQQQRRQQQRPPQDDSASSIYANRGGGQRRESGTGAEGVYYNRGGVLGDCLEASAGTGGVKQHQDQQAAANVYGFLGAANSTKNGGGGNSGTAASSDGGVPPDSENVYGMSVPVAPREGGSIYANHDAVIAEDGVYWNTDQTRAAGAGVTKGEGGIYGLRTNSAAGPPATLQSNELYGIAQNLSAAADTDARTKRGSEGEGAYWNYKPELSQTRPSQRATSSVKQRTVAALAAIPSTRRSSSNGRSSSGRRSSSSWSSSGGGSSSGGSDGGSMVVGSALRRSSVASQGVGGAERPAVHEDQARYQFVSLVGANGAPLEEYHNIGPGSELISAPSTSGIVDSNDGRDGGGGSIRGNGCAGGGDGGSGGGGNQLEEDEEGSDEKKEDDYIACVGEDDGSDTDTAAELPCSPPAVSPTTAEARWDHALMAAATTEANNGGADPLAAAASELLDFKRRASIV